MSWPYGPGECPRCHFFERLDPPAVDDVGYEIVGLCSHPRIRMDLFLLKSRDPSAMEPCPCFLSSPGRTDGERPVPSGA